MRTIFLIISLSAFIASAQPPRVSNYAINHIALPESMDNQICISGMKYMKGLLYLASERCPSIFVADPATGAIRQTIAIKVPQNFEMEGMTSYNNKLYLVSENIAAVYEVTPETGDLKQVKTSIPLPQKSKHGDGMEGIASNETHHKFYLLRERNEERTKTELYTFNIQPGNDATISLQYESKMELPLLNPQWRYSDICLDVENNMLILLKSYSKGKTRKQYLESLNIDENGNLIEGSLQNIEVEKFSEISNEYKSQRYSMNLEGITLDEKGNFFLVSDNTSGKAQCDQPADEKTILLQLRKR